jgi:nucleotide-binding universal stress UspA family protein
MQKIVLATDFSTRSDRAVRRAGLLARDQGARVILLHVVDDDRPERLVAEEMATARELLEATAGSAFVTYDARSTLRSEIPSKASRRLREKARPISS